MRQKLAGLESENRLKAGSKRMSRFPKEYQDAYLTPVEQRTPLQTPACIHGRQAGRCHQGRNGQGDEPGLASGARWESLNKQMESFSRAQARQVFPPPMGMSEIGTVAPPTFLLKRGDVKSHGVEVAPGFPSAIDDREALVPDQPLAAKTTGRRSELANWLTSSENPLTARVAVNRLWQHHFGRGIVGTPSDFGIQGDVPTHPELLDWLAVEFMARGWSPKAMHRLMVTSAAYHQASTPIAHEKDSCSRSAEPEGCCGELGGAGSKARCFATPCLPSAIACLNNRMIAGRVSIRRLPTETPGVRAGPSRCRPRGIGDRRSVYIYVKRNLRFPLFDLFDVPDRNETCSRRHVTTNAPQALALLNSQLTRDMARSLARRVLEESGRDADSVGHRRGDAAFALGRSPDALGGTANAFRIREASECRGRSRDGTRRRLPRAPELERIPLCGLIDHDS